MGDFKTDLKKRDLLFSAFHERKNYCDNWIQRIDEELEDQTLDEKAINKKMIGLEKWKNLHPVIEKYIDSVGRWDKLYFAELWKIVTDDRELADVVYNGILQLKVRIVQNRDSEGLPILHADMSNLAYGRDSKDYQEWALLNELENGLRDAFRQDQQQTASSAADRIKENAGVPGKAKQPAFRFIKRYVQDEPKFQSLRYMKQGARSGDFKTLKSELFAAFQSTHPELNKQVKFSGFCRYITDSLNDLYPDRKQTSDV